MINLKSTDVYGSYKRYQNARDAAWKALIDFHVCKLPVSLSGICKDLGIAILDNKHANELQPGENGIAVMQNDKWYIIFDDTDIYGKQRFTIAHELGHILMGHEMKNGYYTRRDNISKPADETEADIFASRLLAPACILWGIKPVLRSRFQKCAVSAMRRRGFARNVWKYSANAENF